MIGQLKKMNAVDKSITIENSQYTSYKRLLRNRVK